MPITIAFIFGILAGDKFEPSLGVAIFLFSLSFLPVILGVFYTSLRCLPFIWIAFFFLGIIFIHPVILPEISSKHIKNHLTGERMTVEAVIISSLEPRPKGMRVMVEARRIITEEGLKDVSGKVLLNIQGGIPAGVKRIVFTSRLKEPKNFANPGGFDYEWWLKEQGVFVTGSLSSKALKVLENTQKKTNFIENSRVLIREVVAKAKLKNPEIIKALIIGDSGTVPKEVRDTYSRVGTAHLLAISGIHVGFIAFIFYNLFFWIFRRSYFLMQTLNVKTLSLLLSLFPVFFYGLIAGFPISTERAVLMVSVYVITIIVGRGRDLYNTLALAALVILLIRPGALWGAAFQLSFISVFFIVYLVPSVKNKLENKAQSEKEDEKNKIKRWLRRRVLPLVLVTAAATIGTMPLLALNFHRVSFVAFISNIIIVPVVGFITVPLSLFSVLALPLYEGVSIFLLRLADVSLNIVSVMNEFFLSIPFASIRTMTPTVIEVLCFYIFILTIPSLFSRDWSGKKKAGFVGIFILLIGINFGITKYEERQSKDLKVTFLSIGQGDSALIELPYLEGDGVKRILIDGGGFHSSTFDTGESVIGPFLWKKKIKKIDYVILSHAQRDHMGGLAFILENFSTSEFWWNGLGTLDERTLAEIEKSKIKVRVLDASSEPVVISKVKIEILSPPENAKEEKRNLDLNETSLVLRLSYGKRSFLFTGDIGIDTEARLSKLNITSDVLKVPHHGSQTSSSEVFIKAVSPTIAVFSVGSANRFKFPKASVVKRYKDFGVKRFRTDISGAILISTDGIAIETETHLTTGTEVMYN
ncbi:MAG: DNA internalization-related competence protein ComEC/Rec2 [Deltaproteobacteria bacterium]|nr:DNA internalization-related competence protein ComEC/Rec2 [Deltaproteobacteria bacterium]